MLATKSLKVNTPKPLITIIGPTASGKTNLAIKLARQFNGVIISADSRQIYQGLSIGTNQPAGQWKKTNKEWKKITHQTKIYTVDNIPHFFINFISPKKHYSVAQYQKAVIKLLKYLETSNHLPILVGGTGLYVSSIVEDYQLPTGKPNLKLRNKLDQLSIKQLLVRIKKIDPPTYQKIDKNNKRRLIRALEYVLVNKKSFLNSQAKNTRSNTLILEINPERKKLYHQINQRVDEMLKNGLLKEVKWLLKNYPQSPALKTIGYQEFIPALKKRKEINEAIELVKKNTRNYAKRQLTWFKRMPNIHWLKNYSQAQKLVKKFIKNPQTY